MLKAILKAGFTSLALLATSWAGTVTVTSPANGATVTSPTKFIASASSSAPVTAMRIYVDNQSAFTTYSDKIDTSLTLATGTRNIVVQAWDSTGAVSKTNLTINVTAPAGAVTVSAPANGATVPTTTRLVASATSQNPITAMRVYVDSADVYSTGAASIDTNLNLSPGTRNVLVQAWDATGAVYKQSLTLNVIATQTSGVTISEPGNGANVSSPARFVATAKSATSAPITAMKVYVDGRDSYTVNGAALDASLSLSAGTRNVVIQAWNTSGDVYKSEMTVNVTASTPQYPATAKKFYDIEEMSNWDHCTVCAGINAAGPVAQYAMTQNISNPSMDGRAAEFWIGGSTPYANALWWKQLGSNPSPKNFVYELYFYITQPQYAQALEFDANHTTGGKRYIMGTQCNLRSAGTWDVWDGLAVRWHHTNIPCTSVPAYQWNHLVWEFKRDDNGNVTFLTMTLNGKKHYVNLTFGSLNNNAADINVAFQMDGDYAMHSYKAWLDNVSFIYW